MRLLRHEGLYKVRLVVMTPREKKGRDLTNHCKNRYGNSDKAARKGVRRKKRTSTHRARREGNYAVAQVLAARDPDEVEVSLKADPSPSEHYAKWPDVPVGEILHRKVRDEIDEIVRNGEVHSDVADDFEAWCMARESVSPARAKAWAVYLRGLCSNGVILIPKITSGDQRDLRDALVEFRRSGVL